MIVKKKINVLYICHDRVQMAGAVYSLLDMIDSLGEFINPIIVLRNGIVKKEIEKKGYQCIALPFQLNVTRNIEIGFLRIIRKKIDEVINRWCILYLNRKLKKEQIQIIHSNSVVSTLGYKLSKKMNVKHVWHIREFLDLDFNMIPDNGWENLYKCVYDSDFVIAITKSVFNHWRLESCKESKVLFNAVRSVKDIEYKRKKDKYFLFCSAALSDNKGADFAVSLFCRTNLCKEDYRLKLIGNYSPTYKNKLDEIAKFYGQEAYIDYLGYQYDIKRFMIKSSAFLMCSLNEAMGRVTVEALFYGCPVLGYNAGGTKEIIQDGVDGFLYNNIEEATIKLKNIVSDTHKTNEMICKGLEKAKILFSKENYKEQILKIYNNLI